MWADMDVQLYQARFDLLLRNHGKEQGTADSMLHGIESSSKDPGRTEDRPVYACFDVVV